MRIHLVIIILMFLMPAVSPMEEKVDPRTGRIRLLYIGSSYWGTRPGLIFLSDPKFRPTLIPAITVWSTGRQTFGDPEQDIARSMRIYFPRTYEDLIAKYDFIQLSGCNENVISGRWQRDFTRATREEGLGFAMTDGYRGFGGGPQAHSTWEGSYLDAALLPVNSLTKQFVIGPMWARVLEPDNDLMKSLPLESAPPLMEINEVTMKQGATLLMDIEPQAKPLMAYWDVGEGRCLAWTCDLHGAPRGSGIWQREWNYWIDFVLNLDYFVAGIECPKDPMMMHAIREGF